MIELEKITVLYCPVFCKYEANRISVSVLYFANNIKLKKVILRARAEGKEWKRESKKGHMKRVLLKVFISQNIASLSFCYVH